ncbi:MAG TPA: ACT domain-containing protein, partial [Opitutaceae bacterium]
MEVSWHRASGRRVLWLEGEFAVCRLAADAAEPDWAKGAGAFCSVTRTADELSVICEASRLPAGVRCTRGWRLGRVEGALPHDAVDVLASLVAPLAAAGVSVFACATFDTDYLLVQSAQFAAANRALR